MRVRSTAQAKRLVRTPICAPTAVSRNTGAIASWITFAMSSIPALNIMVGGFRTRCALVVAWRSVSSESLSSSRA